MTLTDCVPAVLQNLCLSVALNAPTGATDTAGGHSPAAAATSPPIQDGSAAAAAAESVAESGQDAREGSGEAAAAAQLAGLRLGSQPDEELDPELWDPEDADSCDDLDFMIGGGPGPAIPAGGPGASERRRDAAQEGAPGASGAAWDYVSSHPPDLCLPLCSPGPLS